MMRISLESRPISKISKKSETADQEPTAPSQNPYYNPQKMFRNNSRLNSRNSQIPPRQMRTSYSSSLLLSINSEERPQSSYSSKNRLKTASSIHLQHQRDLNLKKLRRVKHKADSFLQPQ